MHRDAEPRRWMEVRMARLQRESETLEAEPVRPTQKETVAPGFAV